MASIALMVLSSRGQLFTPIHQTLSAVVQPIRLATNLPGAIYSTAMQHLRSRRELLARVAELEDQQLLYESRLQRLDSLEVENIRLRDLLDSSFQVEDSVLIAELMRVDLDPYTQLIQIDKGAGSGVYAGQPVLDAGGVIGQVDRAGPFTATVRLITDRNHAIPVEINRNGVRAVLVGSGELHQLELTGLPNSTDVRPGDLLMSSGLGGRFPAGYPVARVTEVNKRPGEPFVEVTARPAGDLDRIQEVLLVRHDQSGPRFAGSGPEGSAVLPREGPSS